mmetsp:Transcript_13313/g.39604  ORF Transcript_13313/g.39604 Transcript_13313/m.39604 type:complete len:209 (-) Transcript_13313:263-889(-)
MPMGARPARACRLPVGSKIWPPGSTMFRGRRKKRPSSPAVKPPSAGRRSAGAAAVCFASAAAVSVVGSVEVLRFGAGGGSRRSSSSSLSSSTKSTKAGALRPRVDDAGVAASSPDSASSAASGDGSGAMGLGRGRFAANFQCAAPAQALRPARAPRRACGSKKPYSLSTRASSQSRRSMLPSEADPGVDTARVGVVVSASSSAPHPAS